MTKTLDNDGFGHLELVRFLLRSNRKRHSKPYSNKVIKSFFRCIFFRHKWRKTCEVSINCKPIIKNFDVIWENSFDCQKDSLSCGVFVLMYMSYKLGLLAYDPASERISKIRNLMALELFIGKLTTKRYEEHKQDTILKYVPVPLHKNNRLEKK